MYLCDLFVDSTIIPPPIEILRSLHTCWVGWDILPKVFREFSPRPNLILIPVNKSPREKKSNFLYFYGPTNHFWQNDPL